MTYAKECLDREAADLMERLDLFTIPIECFSGGKQPIRKKLVARAQRLSDVDPKSALQNKDAELEMKMIRAMNEALANGDEELAAKIEADWNAGVEQRRAEAGAAYLAERTHMFGDMGAVMQAHQQGFI